MQDPDVPPQVEGDTNGVVDVARQNEAAPAARWAATARNIRGSLRLPWITATAPTWAATTATAAADRDGRAFPGLTRCSIPSRYRLRALTRLHGSSPLLKICFS